MKIWNYPIKNIWTTCQILAGICKYLVRYWISDFKVILRYITNMFIKSEKQDTLKKIKATLQDMYLFIKYFNNVSVQIRTKKNKKAKWISARMLRTMATLVWFCFSKNSLKARPFMFAQGIYHTTYIIMRLVCSQSCCLPDHHIKRRFT